VSTAALVLPAPGGIGWDFWVGPFVEFGFMRHALVAALALAASSAPLGALLVLRRMSLLGDAMAHALLPGAALGFVIAGFSLVAMGAGALAAALVVAALAGWVSRATRQREDASFAAFYLIALALGVMIMSLNASPLDLMHLLFGSVLAVDRPALMLVAGVATITLAALAVLWRPLVVESLDPQFLRSVGGRGGWVQQAFIVLVVLNLVAGFQALGTLMAVGLMILPATAARYWARSLVGLCLLAAAIGLASAYLGLLLSFHFELPSGPSIVLLAGAAYLGSALFGREGGLWVRRASPRPAAAG
jgi:zinc/manganese transport system permease protein